MQAAYHLCHVRTGLSSVHSYLSAVDDICLHSMLYWRQMGDAFCLESRLCEPSQACVD